MKSKEGESKGKGGGEKRKEKKGRGKERKRENPGKKRKARASPGGHPEPLHGVGWRSLDPSRGAAKEKEKRLVQSERSQEDTGNRAVEAPRNHCC